MAHGNSCIHPHWIIFVLTFFFGVDWTRGLGLLAQICFSHPICLLRLNDLHPPPIFIFLSDFQLISKALIWSVAYLSCFDHFVMLRYFPYVYSSLFGFFAY
jgi:hypothetical protein